MRKISWIVGLMLLAGCATTGNKNWRDSWIGRNENELIGQWGPPSETYRMPNQNIIYTWKNRGSGPTISRYDRYYHQYETYSNEIWCNQSFTVNPQGTIIDWHTQGNYCQE